MDRFTRFAGNPSVESSLENHRLDHFGCLAGVAYCFYRYPYQNLYPKTLCAGSLDPVYLRLAALPDSMPGSFHPDRKPFFGSPKHMDRFHKPTPSAQRRNDPSVSGFGTVDVFFRDPAVLHRSCSTFHFLFHLRQHMEKNKKSRRINRRLTPLHRNKPNLRFSLLTSLGYTLSIQLLA